VRSVSERYTSKIPTLLILKLKKGWCEAPDTKDKKKSKSKIKAPFSLWSFLLYSPFTLRGRVILEESSIKERQKEVKSKSQ
jgi:hypothetical protein